MNITMRIARQLGWLPEKQKFEINEFRMDYSIKSFGLLFSQIIVYLANINSVNRRGLSPVQFKFTWTGLNLI